VAGASAEMIFSCFLVKSEVTVLFEGMWVTDNHFRHECLKPIVTPKTFYRLKEIFELLTCSNHYKLVLVAARACHRKKDDPGVHRASGNAGIYHVNPSTIDSKSDEEGETASQGCCGYGSVVHFWHTDSLLTNSRKAASASEVLLNWPSS
jgi:hypothetical protein